MLLNLIDIFLFQKKHLKLNIINIRFNFLYIIIFISTIIFSYTGPNNTFCSFNLDCNDCIFCGEKNIDYHNCNYDNIFCKRNKQYYYSPQLKAQYDAFFRKDEEINSLCGKEKIELNLQVEPFKILEINKNNYPKGKFVHCLYSFNNLEKYSKNEPSIIFQINSSEKNLDNKIKFKIIIEHTNAEEEKKLLLISNDNFLDKNIFEESVSNTDNLLIFIDILNINYNGDENLEIKYKISKKAPAFDLPSILLYGIMFLVFLIIVIIVLIKFCCPFDICKKSKKKENRYSRQIRANRDEHLNNIIIVSQKGNGKEIKKKIDYLLNKVLKNDFFIEKLFQKYRNKCSICHKNFIEGTSQISITPCDHIFHLDFIKKWIESNGSTFYCPNCKYYFIKNEDENNSPIMPIKRNMMNNDLRLNSNSNRRLNNDENNNSHLTA